MLTKDKAHCARLLCSCSYFTRSAVVENMQFGARTVVQRTDKGDRQTIGLQDLPILVHVFVQSNGNLLSFLV